MSRKILFKVIVVGDGGVGKSTMIQRLITGQFMPQKITIGTDLATWDINIENARITLQIWDFAGEKRFRFFLPNYSRGAYGVLLCYDTTRYVSFENLEEWYSIIKENTDGAVIALVGGKNDLVDKKAVPLEAAQKFQKKYSIDLFFETSSVSGMNNNKIFKSITKEIIKKRQIEL
ncbi:MAG: GTP-binding protein [Promethearchaeota archaeon]